MLTTSLLLGYGLLSAIPLVSALGSACSTPIGGGTAAPGDPFWMQNIQHQGTSAFNSDPSSYQVFRNVKDFGATGDGQTDDTDAINNAISSGSRCGGGSCPSSTVTPAVVFFPSGTYKVSAPLIAYYYTQFIGDARSPPTLLAASNFSGLAVIDADPYIPNGYGAQWYDDTNNFFRSVRNFVIDLTQTSATASSTGIHWQVSQGTSLYNIVVEMSTASDTAHQGIFMENGSGGFFGDLVFNGGKYGIWVGNQQFTVRNVTFNNANTAIYADWNWGWTFQAVNINNCQIGFDVQTGGSSENDQTVGAEAIIDAVVSNTPIFIQTSTNNNSLAGSLVLNNIQLTNVPTAVAAANGDVALAGGTTTIASWGQGNVYSGTSQSYSFVKGNIPAPNKASSLTSYGKIFGRTRPQYEDYAVSQFVSVKSNGAKGDGNTDDTAALQAIFDKYSGCSIIFFDAGTYVVTSTLQIPAGTQMIGEAWSVIMGRGSAFANQNSPTVMVQVGASGSSGILEITDIIFTTQGPTPGAIVVEWNVNSPTQGGAGTWDTHIRLGGADGTDLQTSQCPSGSDSSSCYAAFLALHLTSGSNAYLEGLWVWLADHDLDNTSQGQLTIFSGRGILSQSAGPVWLIGVAEHHSLYQFSLVNAQDHYLGLIQTETPYYQPSPAPPTPFTIESSYDDPSFPSGETAAWAVSIQSSSNIIIFGAGHYSFYQNFGQDCLSSNSCQAQIVNTDSGSSVYVYSLSTVGTTYQFSVNSNGVIPESSNVDGLQSTATVWTQ